MSLRSFIDSGSEKAEEDRMILLWKKWGVAMAHDVVQAYHQRDGAKAPFALFEEEWKKQRPLYTNLINQMSQQEKKTFYNDLTQGKILAKKRAFEDARADKIIQVTPLITVRGGQRSESQYSLSIESGRRMNNLIGEIDEKLVARMNDANADREEMKNLIGDIDEKLVARMNDANAEREEMKNLIGDIDEKLVARMNDANADREEMRAPIYMDEIDGLEEGLEEMKNLIGDIDEKLVARMNDANAEREEMKASINSIQERMKISERILQKVINFIISSNS